MPALCQVLDKLTDYHDYQRYYRKPFNTSPASVKTNGFIILRFENRLVIKVKTVTVMRHVM